MIRCTHCFGSGRRYIEHLGGYVVCRRCNGLGAVEDNAASYMLMCDENGMAFITILNTLRSRPYEGPPFECTGSFTSTGLTIWCSNPIHISEYAMYEAQFEAYRERAEHRIRATQQKASDGSS